MSQCIDDLLSINESITDTVNAAAALEQHLKDKTIATLEELNELREKC